MKQRDKVFNYGKEIMKFGSVIETRMIEGWLYATVLWSSGETEQLRRDELQIFDKQQLIKTIENI